MAQPGSPNNRKGQRAERRIAVAERRRQAVEMRAQHLTYAEIARRLGCTPKAAWQDVKRALDQTLSELAESTDELRQLELDRLAAWERKCLEVLQADHPDDGLKLAAVDRLLKISARRAKLLGLDKPVEVDVRQEVVEYTLTLDKELGEPVSDQSVTS